MFFNCFSLITENTLIDLWRKVFCQAGGKVFQLFCFFLDQLPIPNFLLQEFFSFTAQCPFLGSIDKLSLNTVQIGK